MPAYPNTDPHGAAPRPGTESPAALATTVARLRQELATERAANRAAHVTLAGVTAERRRAAEAASAAEAALARVRAVMLRYLGGPGACPKGVTEVDMAEALGQDLRYARNTAERCHSRRRVTEAVTERLLADVARLEAALARAEAERARFPQSGVWHLTDAGAAAVAEAAEHTDGGPE